MFNGGILGRNETSSSEISLFSSLGYGSNYLLVSFSRMMHVWAGVSSGFVIIGISNSASG